MLDTTALLLRRDIAAQDPTDPFPSLSRAIRRALEAESRIRKDARAMVRLVHREPWLIGSPDAQQVMLARSRRRHTESIERTRALYPYRRETT